MTRPEGESEHRKKLLDQDVARERRVLWQGLIAFASVLVLVIARARWWL